MQKTAASTASATKRPTPSREASPTYQLPSRHDSAKPLPKKCKTDSPTKSSHTHRPKTAIKKTGSPQTSPPGKKNSIATDQEQLLSEKSEDTKNPLNYSSENYHSNA